MIGQQLKQHWQSGATIVEVMVAIALTGIFLPVLATALVAAHAGKATSIQQIQAQSLVREASDAVRSIRENGWTNVATDGTYHPVISGSAWTLSAGSEVINGLTRQVVISTPQRNAAGVIVGSGGTNDPSTKHVVVTVSWTSPTSGSLTADTYLTRWQNNNTWIQTLQTDFTSGTLVNTCTTSTCGVLNPPVDSVQLADSPATWQLPSIIGSYNITGAVSGLTVYFATISSVNYAFVGYSGGMAIVNVSNPAAPSLTSTYTAQGQVNGIFIVGTIAYLATSSNTAELVTVDISNPAIPLQLSTLNLGDTGDANTVTVNGNYAYVGKVSATAGNNEFYVVDVTSPLNIIVNGTLARLTANINSICVNPAGTVAYIATSQTNAQFRVVNVTNKLSPASSATVNLGAVANKLDCSSGTYVYIATQNNTTAGEVRVYNVTTPTAPTAVGSGYEMGGNITGLDIDPSNPNYLVLATSVANKQITSLNISTPSSISLISNLSTGSTLNKIMVVGSYAYIGSTNTSQELTVAYTGYRPTGTFESSSFDATTNVGYNYFTFNGNVPANTTLTFQIAANNTNSSWAYVGPDGTAGTSYSVGAKIPLSIVSNRYLRYKATLTTTSSQSTPRIDDVEVNYSL